MTTIKVHASCPHKSITTSPFDLLQNHPPIIHRNTFISSLSPPPAPLLVSSAGMKYSFHRRSLPSPPAISFSSKEGRSIFSSSMSTGGCESYFDLVSHFVTQGKPAYCGLSTLVIVLNALNVDPRRSWRGSPWRYFDEEHLNCCSALDIVEEQGITLLTFGCLCRCQGLSCSSTFHDSIPPATFVSKFRDAIKECCSTPSSTAGRPYLVVSYSRKVKMGFEAVTSSLYTPLVPLHSSPFANRRNCSKLGTDTSPLLGPTIPRPIWCSYLTRRVSNILPTGFTSRSCARRWEE